MRNTVLQNSLAPWQAKGHWYHFFIESDGTAYTLTTADISTAAIDGSYLKFPADFHVIDYAVDIDVDTSAAATFEKGIRLYADGKQAIVLPGKANIDWADIQVFGYIVD